MSEHTTPNPEDVQPSTAASPDAPTGAPSEHLVSEDIQTKGRSIKSTLENLLQEGNIRRILVKNKHGRVLLDIPVTAGVGTVAAAAFLAPWAVAIGAIAAFVSSVTITVVRDTSDDASTDAPSSQDPTPSS